MSFCENCGSEITPGAKFCENCGTPVPSAGGLNGGTPAGGIVQTPPETEPEPKKGPEGKGDDGVHEWKYDQTSAYSAGTAGKGKHESVVVKIIIIVVIVVAALIVLFFLGLRKAGKELQKFAENYNISEIENTPLYEESFLNGYWAGEISIIPDEDFLEYSDMEDFEWKEIYAYIGDSASGRKFFEVYDEEYYENEPILSMYINETEQGFRADIGEEDAWLYDVYLTKENEEDFETDVENDSFSIFCPYTNEGSEYWVMMYFYKE